MLNLKDLQLFFPDNVQSSRSSKWVPSQKGRSNLESENPNERTEDTDDSRELQESSGTSDDLSDNAVNDLNRLFISHDMGWSKRGSGHQYDSLKGYATMIGTQ